MLMLTMRPNTFVLPGFAMQRNGGVLWSQQAHEQLAHVMYIRPRECYISELYPKKVERSAVQERVFGKKSRSQEAFAFST
jgi:hypothetical protein